MSKPMSDLEVISEMKKLVAFIKQEAMEKAREIKVKADEEFSIEKAKLVRQETASIDASYAKRRKQVEVQKRITQSTQSNKSRLQQLQVRDQLLEKVFGDARNGLGEATKDSDKYREIVEKLTLQALFSLMAKDITVTIRPQDSKIAEKAISQALKNYKQISGIDCTHTIKEDLPKESRGGIIVWGYNNRIKVNNTLDERLKLLEEKMLPEIRTSLYGKNPNRKHET
ncbi:ATPase, V1/A1 complex, subunit E [Phakopsora pachyrhizi]|uniref:ATPase, V1/A1 complex, subunit E n=1 Tax=Phakopsora pachyrhizi TaxID=170000 RepID=A0AAV0BIV7_PHAPC|nr:ATPase, V1/A1 complex, subunit E [Phakopsora pachyrhizi]KAI8450293.1 ATPase, V1/A1 complex, subunit E [Phakopsora pachyrhizi]CAH7687133.1 ATPase, V1/A1 complex, subunit E [Phakopsora pachyrhizi]